MKPLLLLALLAGMQSLAAQGKKKKNKDKNAVAAEAPKPASDKATIASKTKNCKLIPGLFSLYQDTTNGKLFMLLSKEQLDKEYIHFAYTENGVLDAGFNRGQYRGSRIFKIRKVFDNIEFEQQNTGFYFDPENAISKSAEANVSASILAFEKIVGFDEKKGQYLIDADEMLLSEKLHQIKPVSMPGNPFGFNLGGLSKSKTRYETVNNYPKNTDLRVKYVFDNPSPMNGGSDEVTDARSVSIIVQHSFIEVPNNGYQPRFDDARIGYFSEQINDMTSREAVNYRDLIHRWNLQKKDPLAAISEPVTPIKWWIENTTPVEFRQTIKDAALEWNKAFEPLGFRNAVQIEIQSDTATWDAGDIRYNVLRWTSSPRPPFGGYGPSFVNPRTGEILGADIMLEYVFVTNRLVAEKLFDTRSAHDAEQIPGNPGRMVSQENLCAAADHLHNEVMLGAQYLAASGGSKVEVTKLIRESLHYLVLHEMGHTLGLMHNMKASQLHSPEELKNPVITANSGVIGSVMDYPAINLNGELGADLQYCQVAPGPYDMWAVEYGYSVAAADAEAEQRRLEKILARSSDPRLTFGNDADDMRSPGKGIDPRVMINDLSNDGISYGVERIEMTRKIMGTLKDRYVKTGENYQELKNAVNILNGGYAGMAGIISRYIGGVYVERTVAGTPDAVQPYTPVSYADQKRAMKALADYAFAPDAMTIPADLIPYMQSQRRGFGFFVNTEDPKLHDAVSAMQTSVLAHLSSVSVLKRLTDSRAYGNKYSVNEMMGDLTNAIFKADLAGSVNTHRQLLQNDYVNLLLEMVDEKASNPYDEISKATAMAQLNSIKAQLKAAAAGDKESKDHRAYIVARIDKALKA